jgi:hypothetical protein
MSAKFCATQTAYERKIEWKRQLQKEVIKFSNAIKKVEVEL